MEYMHKWSMHIHKNKLVSSMHCEYRQNKNQKDKPFVH